MKIVADQNIPFVAECLASVGQVTVLPGRRITRDALAGRPIRLCFVLKDADTYAFGFAP